MKKTIYISFVFLSSLCLSVSSFAGGCVEKVMPTDKLIVANYMAADLVKNIKKMDEQMGGDNEVMVIARLGESMDGFSKLKDKFSNGKSLEETFQGLEKYMYRWLKESLSGTKHTLAGEKLKYSHIGFILKNKQTTADKEKGQVAWDWNYVTHLLAHCDPNSERYGSSRIYTQPTYQFFWDSKIIESKDSKENEMKNQVMIMVPRLDIQKRLRELLREKNDNISINGLHEPNYNVISSFRNIKPNKLDQNLRIYGAWLNANEEKLVKKAEKYDPSTKKGNKKKYKRAKEKRDKYLQTIDQIVDENIKLNRLSPKKAHQLKYQNSSQWPLEMLAASTLPIGVVKNRFEVMEVLNHENDIDTNCDEKYSRGEDINNCEQRANANTAYIPSIVYPDSFKNGIACSHTDGLFNLGIFWDATNLIDCKIQSYRDKDIHQLITAESVAKWLSKNDFLRADAVHIPTFRKFPAGIYEFTSDPNMLRLAKAIGHPMVEVQKEYLQEIYNKRIRDYMKKHRVEREVAKKELRRQKLID